MEEPDRKLENLFVDDVQLLVKVYSPTLAVQCSTNTSFYCVMYVDEGVFSDKATSTSFKKLQEGKWNFICRSVLGSFGSEAKPLKLKIEFYKEVFLIGKLVSEAEIVLADYADGKDHDFSVPLWNKCKRNGSANLNLKISVDIRTLLTRKEIDECYLSLRKFNPTQIPHLRTISEKWNLLQYIQWQNKQERDGNIRKTEPAEYVSLLRDDGMDPAQWRRLQVHLVDLEWQKKFVELLCGVEYLLFLLSRVNMHLRSRVVPSKEGLSVLESVLLCLYRIKSFKMVPVAPEDCSSLLLCLGHISMTDKLLLFDVYKKVLKFHPQQAVVAFVTFIIVNPDEFKLLPEELLNGKNMLFKIYFLETLSMLTGKANGKQKRDLLELLYDFGITLEAMKNLKSYFPDKEVIEEIDKYVEISELTTYKTRDDAIEELKKKLAELEKQVGSDDGEGGSGKGKRKNEKDGKGSHGPDEEDDKENNADDSNQAGSDRNSLVDSAASRVPKFTPNKRFIEVLDIVLENPHDRRLRRKTQQELLRRQKTQSQEQADKTQEVEEAKPVEATTEQPLPSIPVSVPAGPPLPPAGCPPLPPSGGPPLPPSNGPLPPGGIPLPPRFCATPIKKPSNIRTLRVKKISLHHTKDTVFEEIKTIQAAKKPLDLDKLAEMFTPSPLQRRRSMNDTPKSKLGQKNELSFCDSRRKQQVDIFLKRMPVNSKQIRTCLQSLSLKDMVSHDQLDLLYGLFCVKKNEQEVEGFKTVTLEMVAKMLPSEKFLYDIYQINNISEKMEMLLFKEQFKTLFQHAMDNGTRLVSFTSRLKSDNFKLLLAYIIDVANTLQAGNAVIHGFQMSSLQKSPNNPQLSVLHYLVELIDEKSPELLSFAQENIQLASDAVSAIANLQSVFPILLKRLWMAELQLHEHKTAVEAEAVEEGGEATKTEEKKEGAPQIEKKKESKPELKKEQKESTGDVDKIQETTKKDVDDDESDSDEEEEQESEFDEYGILKADLSDEAYYSFMESLRDTVKTLTELVHQVDDEIVFLGNHNNDEPENATIREIKSTWASCATTGIISQEACLTRAKRDEDRYTFFSQIHEFLLDLRKGHVFVSAKKEKEREKIKKEKRLQESTQEESVSKNAAPEQDQPAEVEETSGMATITVMSTTIGNETVTTSPARGGSRASTPYSTPSKRIGTPYPTEKRVSTPYRTPSKLLGEDVPSVPDGKRTGTPIVTPTRATPLSSPFFHRLSPFLLSPSGTPDKSTSEGATKILTPPNFSLPAQSKRRPITPASLPRPQPWPNTGTKETSRPTSTASTPSTKLITTDYSSPNSGLGSPFVCSTTRGRSLSDQKPVNLLPLLDSLQETEKK